MIIRNFKESDMSDFKNLMNQILVLDSYNMTNNAKNDLLELYTKETWLLADYSIVYELDQKIIGVLFAEFKPQKIKINMQDRIDLINRYQGDDKANIEFQIELLDKCQKLKTIDKDNCELTMLVIDKLHRNQQLGKKIVKQFSEEAKKRGFKSFELFTDMNCNYQFYHHMNYELIKEIPCNTSYSKELTERHKIFNLWLFKKNL